MTCSRCTKRVPVLFQYERVTKNKGLREVNLCANCTKWALMTLLTGPDSAPLFEQLFAQCEEISHFIREQKAAEKERKALNKPF